MSELMTKKNNQEMNFTKDTNQNVKKNQLEENNKNDDEQNITINLSSDDEYQHEDDITITTSDSDFDPDESEDQGLDTQEYRKFLYKLYPSKHLNNKIKSFDKLKDTIKNKEICESDDNKSVSHTEESESISDDSGSYDSEEKEELKKIMKDGMKFDIVLNVGKNDETDEQTDDETDDEESIRHETDEDESDVEHDETETEAHDEKQNLENKNSNTKKYAKNKSKGDKKCSKLDKKNNIVNCDSDTEETFKDMIKIFKNKKENKQLPREVFDKFNNYLDKCKEKYEKQKKEQELRLKHKNNQLFKKHIRGTNRMNDYRYFKTLDIKKQNEIIYKLKEIQKNNKQEKPYRIQLIESDIPNKYKAEVLKKINSLNTIDQGSGEYYKVKQWIDTFMRIPFNTYQNLPVRIEDGIDTCNKFMEQSKNTLNNAVFGLDDAKLQIMQMMGQWISNPSSVGSAIAIKGPMGTGKTTLVKEGISKILNRPFFFITLGGATDSSFLEGHSYTYEGSVWGKIVDILIQSKCMNPVIYFDELDKVSSSPRGEEIIGILTHLTDTSQNNQYHDKYFSGIDFDLSKALFIFSYNDEEKVNKILKDRMYRIKTEGYNKTQKITIAKHYLIPSIEKNIHFKKNDITFDDEALSYMIDDLTENEKGVRNLKRCLEIVFTKLNLYRFMKPNTEIFKDTKTFNVELPFHVTKNVVETLIKQEKEDEFYKHIYV